MGLLDDLEQEAQKKREEKEGVLARRRDFFKTTTIPAMEGLYDYLSRLSKSLNFLKSERRTKFKVLGYGDVTVRIENDMTLQAQMPMYAREIKLTVTGIIDTAACPQIKIEGAGKVEALAENFRRVGFEGMQKMERDEKGNVLSAIFQPWGKVQMSAIFATDMNSEVLRMEFMNFDSLGIRRETVAVASLNDDLFDEIGKYIALQQNYVVRETISDDMREAWRRGLQTENQKREVEQKIAVQQVKEMERLEQQKKPGSITERIKAVIIDTSEPEPKKDEPGLLGKLFGFGKKK